MKKNGFTFIELLIAIGVISISLPLIFGLLFINLKAQSKTSILEEVKRNGDFALNTMSFLLRQYGQRITDSTYTSDICPTSPNSESPPSDKLYVVDKFGKGFTFFSENDKIASSSPDLPMGNDIAAQYLTNNRVKVEDLLFSCYQPTIFDPAIVSVSFTVLDNNGNVRYEEKATLNYATKIKLRN